MTTNMESLIMHFSGRDSSIHTGCPMNAQNNEEKLLMLYKQFIAVSALTTTKKAKYT